ncbi:DUF4825 domain-containing protein [Priestia flexa]
MLFFAFITLLVGCNSINDASQKNASIDVKKPTAAHYSYNENQHDATSIINELPGHENVHNITLQTKRSPSYISVDYTQASTETSRQFEHNWSANLTKERVFNNATILLGLIDYADSVHFNVHTVVPQSITITRAELEEFHQHPLKPNASKGIQNVSAENDGNEHQINEFFRRHPITELE